MNIKNLIHTSRPLYWLVHLIFFIYGVVASGNFVTVWDVRFLLPAFIFTLPYGYFIYAVNDYYDDVSDKLNKRKGGVFGSAHSDKSRQQLLKGTFVAFIFSGIAFSLFGLSTMITYLVMSAVLFFYSAPPFRTKGIPFFDFITGGTLYGLLIYLMGFVIFGGDVNYWMTHTPTTALLLGVFAAVYHIMLAMFDVEPDRAQGIRTTPVTFGPTFTLIFCMVILLLSLRIAISEHKLVAAMVSRIVFALLLFSLKLQKSPFMQKLIGEYSIYLSFILTLLALLISPGSLI